MISLQAVRRAGLSLVDVHNGLSPTLAFRLHKAILRLEKRYGAAVAATWTQTVLRVQGRIDLHALQSAISSGQFQVIDAAVDAGALQLALDQAMQDTLTSAAQAGGQLAATALKKAGIDTSFNAIHPNIILRAATKSAALVRAVPDDVRAMIRSVVSLGAAGQLTIQEQARIIKASIGLPPNQGLAPYRLGEELRAGDLEAALARRLSAVDQARIRAVLSRGDASPAFVTEMQEHYAASLTSLRGETIARTESLSALNWGVHEAWNQAVAAGDLPDTVRRFWIITPDEALCPICIEIPGMNPDGVALDEPFQTPDGPVDDPPAPHPNCRCSTGLVLPGATATPEEVPTPETPPAEPVAPEQSIVPTVAPLVTPPLPVPPVQPLEGREASRYLNRLNLEGAPDYLGSLSADELDALHAYEGSGYARINSYLRQGYTDAGTEATQRLKDRIRHIDAAMAKAPKLARPVTTWRGAEMSAAPEVGSIISDAAFVSTSTNTETADGFLRGIDKGRRFLLKIDSPAGTRAVWMPTIGGDHASELELLLPRGSRFEVVAIDRRIEDYVTIELRLLP